MKNPRARTGSAPPYFAGRRLWASSSEPCGRAFNVFEAAFGSFDGAERVKVELFAASDHVLAPAKELLYVFGMVAPGALSHLRSE
jgi:hypothetical protein